MGVFLQPKSNNLKSSTGQVFVNQTRVLTSEDGELIGSGKTTAVQIPHPASKAIEAPPNWALPTGGKSEGISSPGVHGWGGPASKTGSSGFGKGTRAGRAGVASRAR